jgi:hypothetical protein
MLLTNNSRFWREIVVNSLNFQVAAQDSFVIIPTGYDLARHYFVVANLQPTFTNPPYQPNLNQPTLTNLPPTHLTNLP